ncbi:putative phosphoesterase [Breznakia sp. PF5-3]|uniref:metallophosphoesterase family protein n=1 Tax=unclassified Breznakia TaxID=2623764 RepID=UPI002407583B|nr:MULTISPECIES: metallophosphoesterase family protein [unclassified Breznakia]MDF9824125.1 putative phosphoesterase [Breznakia sp. PM6-1]MDF9834923.1 putative phosphoesterase [Breznakia sp. PF5-3]MDF9837208.1 putative phosphoesterase [Breznakia sp. PFB2-8]MDF9859198.1 putative phosphoesterase [Breznakia sp. PH5-24]
MKIVVVSDSHSMVKPLKMILDKHADADYFLHCGDICLPPEEYPRYITVCGNNDYYDYPMEMILNLGKHRLIMFHSHMISYFKREEKMIRKAKNEGCDIVCYGHTHVAYYEIKNGVHILNPGSVYHSRDGRAPSYAIMNIDDQSGNIEVNFEFLD